MDHGSYLVVLGRYSSLAWQRLFAIEEAQRALQCAARQRKDLTLLEVFWYRLPREQVAAQAKRKTIRTNRHDLSLRECRQGKE